MTDWLEEAQRKTQARREMGKINWAQEAGIETRQTLDPAKPKPTFGEMASDLVTGNSRREFDLPEFGWSAPIPEEFVTRLMGANVASSTPDQLADIFLKNIPGTTARSDKFGNPIISYKNKDYYVNRPGLSSQDFSTATGQFAGYLPAAKYASRGATAASRVKRGATGGAATSMTLDILAGGMGSEQGIDFGRAAFAGGGGALGEAVVPLGVMAWRKLFGNPRYFQNNQLTPEGQKAAEAAGLDPNDAIDAFGKDFGRDLEMGASPQYARARQEGSEFGIPYTRGQATQDRTRLSREEAIRHDTGKGADRLQAFDERQQAAMQSARGDIQSRLGGQGVGTPAEAGDIVGRSVRTRADVMTKEIDELYKNVPGEDVVYTANNMRPLFVGIRSGLKENGWIVDPVLTPAAHRSIKELVKLQRSVKKGQKVDFTKFEVTRRKLGAAYESAKNNADRGAIKEIKRQYDDFLEDASDRALFSGDEGALESMKKARARRAEYGKLFEARGRDRAGIGRERTDPSGRAIQKMLVEDVTPEEAINYVFGKSRLGSSPDSVRIVKRIKQIVGEDGPEIAALKEAAWLKLTKDVGKENFSPTKYKNELNRVFEENNSLMQELFSKSEMAEMRRFRDAVMKTVTPESLKNPSKTAYTAKRLIREWIGRIGTMLTFSGNPVGGGLFFTMKRAPSWRMSGQAKEAVRPLPGPVPAVPSATATGMAGGAQYEELEQ